LSKENVSCTSPKQNSPPQFQEMLSGLVKSYNVVARVFLHGCLAKKKKTKKGGIFSLLFITHYPEITSLIA